MDLNAVVFVTPQSVNHTCVEPLTVDRSETQRSIGEVSVKCVAHLTVARPKVGGIGTIGDKTKCVGYRAQGAVADDGRFCLSGYDNLLYKFRASVAAGYVELVNARLIGQGVGNVAVAYGT